MLLHLAHFLPLYSPLPCPLFPPTFLPPPLSSCPWVIHLSSLYSTFPILFLTSPCLFLPTIYASYSLYLFPHSSLSPLITLHGIFISVNLFLFYLFLVFLFCCVLFCFLGSVLNSWEFVVIFLFIFFYLLFLR